MRKKPSEHDLCMAAILLADERTRNQISTYLKMDDQDRYAVDCFIEFMVWRRDKHPTVLTEAKGE
jgi:hypothetical protein